LRNSAGAEALAVARRPEEASREIISCFFGVLSGRMHRVAFDGSHGWFGFRRVDVCAMCKARDDGLSVSVMVVALILMFL